MAFKLSKAFLSAKAKAQARDSKGRFIRMNSLVRWKVNGVWYHGQVSANTPDTQGRVEITLTGSKKKVKVRTRELEVIKAILEPKNVAQKKSVAQDPKAIAPPTKKVAPVEVIGPSGNVPAEESKAPVFDPARAEPQAPAEIQTFDDDTDSIVSWEKISGQLGSNKGALYRAPDGGQYYVKTPKSELHGANEVAAARLYQLAGVNVPDVDLKKDADGETVVVTSAWLESDPKLKTSSSHAMQVAVRKDMPIDAWLANWDVIGLDHDNVIALDPTKPYRIDTGGGLLFRAQGSPKGDKFGTQVGELTTLRDPYINPTAAVVFGQASKDEWSESLGRLATLTDTEVEDALDGLPFSDEVKQALVATLNARKYDLLGSTGTAYDEKALKGLDQKALAIPGESDDDDEVHVGDVVTSKTDGFTGSIVKINNAKTHALVHDPETKQKKWRKINTLAHKVSKKIRKLENATHVGLPTPDDASMVELQDLEPGDEALVPASPANAAEYVAEKVVAEQFAEGVVTFTDGDEIHGQATDQVPVSDSAPGPSLVAGTTAVYLDSLGQYMQGANGTQIRIGDEVQSIKDGSTGVVVGFEKKNTGAKVKLPDGTVKARKSYLLFPTASEQQPSQPPPSKAPEAMQAVAAKHENPTFAEVPKQSGFASPTSDVDSASYMLTFDGKIPKPVMAAIIGGLVAKNGTSIDFSVDSWGKKPENEKVQLVVDMKEIASGSMPAMAAGIEEAIKYLDPNGIAKNESPKGEPNFKALLKGLDVGLWNINEVASYAADTDSTVGDLFAGKVKWGQLPAADKAGVMEYLETTAKNYSFKPGTAQSFTNVAIALKGFEPPKVKDQLLQAGIDEQTINDAHLEQLKGAGVPVLDDFVDGKVNIFDLDPVTLSVLGQYLKNVADGPFISAERKNALELIKNALPNLHTTDPPTPAPNEVHEPFTGVLADLEKLGVSKVTLKTVETEWLPTAAEFDQVSKGWKGTSAWLTGAKSWNELTPKEKKGVSTFLGKTKNSYSQSYEVTSAAKEIHGKLVTSPKPAVSVETESVSGFEISPGVTIPLEPGQSLYDLSIAGNDPFYVVTGKGDFDPISEWQVDQFGNKYPYSGSVSLGRLVAENRDPIAAGPLTYDDALIKAGFLAIDDENTYWASTPTKAFISSMKKANADPAEVVKGLTHFERKSIADYVASFFTDDESRVEFAKFAKKHLGEYKHEWNGQKLLDPYSNNKSPYVFTESQRAVFNALNLPPDLAAVVTKKRDEFSAPEVHSFNEGIGRLYYALGDDAVRSRLRAAFGNDVDATLNVLRGPGFMPEVSGANAPWNREKLPSLDEALPGIQVQDGTKTRVGDIVTSKNGKTGFVVGVNTETDQVVVRTPAGTKHTFVGKSITSSHAPGSPEVTKALKSFTLSGRSEEINPQPVDWTKGSVVPGAPGLGDVFSRVIDENNAATGASVMLDVDQVEDMDVRFTGVQDVNGAVSLQGRYKLTPWRMNAVEAMLAIDDQWKKNSGVTVDALQWKKDVGNGPVPSTGSKSFSVNTGTTYTRTLPNGTRITIVSQNGTITAKDSRSFHATVKIDLPEKAYREGGSQSLVDALRAGGIDEPGPPSQEAVTRFAENRLLSLFGKDTDANKVMSGDQRKKTLEAIETTWKVKAADMEIRAGSAGRIELVLPDAIAESIADVTGVTSFKHAVSGGHNRNRLLNIMLHPAQALMSTTVRRSEGVGSVDIGMSEQEDIESGGADYIFTSPSSEWKGSHVGVIYFSPSRLFKRTDFYTNSGDNYGKRAGGHDIIATTTPYAHETIWKHRVGFEDAYGMVVDSDDRLWFIEELKLRGITHIGGRPVEDFIMTPGTKLDPELLPPAPPPGAPVTDLPIEGGVPAV